MPESAPNIVHGLPVSSHPSASELQTFVFVNPLLGDKQSWDDVIAPALRSKGYGTLTYNLRGQRETVFSDDDPLDVGQAVEDLNAVLAEGMPMTPILIGHSAGGLIAARALLQGMSADGLVLINTLRTPNARLSWIDEALYRVLSVGGLELFKDLLFPVTLGRRTLGDVRADCLSNKPYSGLPAEDGVLRLMDQARRADWDVPYNRLKLPVLVMTGLKDRLFLDNEAVSALIRKLPKPYHVELPEAGHFVPDEDPSAVVDVLTRFAEDLH